MVLSTKEMMEELLYNLCDNAIRYNNENGLVHVSVKQIKDSVVLSVKDTGIGIPKDHQERVFERFYRVDKSFEIYWWNRIRTCYCKAYRCTIECEDRTGFRKRKRNRDPGYFP